MPFKKESTFNMKRRKPVCLLILALVLVYATNGERICDIDSNGKPECTELNVNHTFRNFWDATHYWYCANLNEEPQSIRCPSAYAVNSPSAIWKYQIAF
ncbi:hypothetical protein DOY81_010172 [Sarcophaga bullata]|nr:hypothetical protein DOY81_010172 [Sarcophaga bullata]